MVHVGGAGQLRLLLRPPSSPQAPQVDFLAVQPSDALPQVVVLFGHLGHLLSSLLQLDGLVSCIRFYLHKE